MFFGEGKITAPKTRARFAPASAPHKKRAEPLFSSKEGRHLATVRYHRQRHTKIGYGGSSEGTDTNIPSNGDSLK